MSLVRWVAPGSESKAVSQVKLASKKKTHSSQGKRCGQSALSLLVLERARILTLSSFSASSVRA